MKKFILLLAFFLTITPVFAEKIPVKIKAAQKISTCRDEIEFGDKLRFSVVDDVYKNNKLYIKKDSKVLGMVEYVTDNGWGYGSAEITLKNFKVRDAGGNIIEIESPLAINGFSIMKKKSNRVGQFFSYIGIIFRGKEVDIKYPKRDKKVIFTIWTE